MYPYKLSLKIALFLSASERRLSPQKDLSSLQWKNVYNRFAKGIKTGNVRGINMIIANIIKENGKVGGIDIIIANISLEKE